MQSTLLELAGFACLIAFAYLLWAPAALLVTGVGLLLAGIVSDLPNRGAEK